MTTPSTAYGTPPLNFNGVAAPINFRHKRADIVLQNGANNNIARNDANYLRITGPSAAFSISGFDTPLSGMMLYVQVAISQQLTIKYQALSSVKNQIDTGTYADVVITATPCMITFIYDATAQKWIYGGLQARTPPVSSSGSAFAKISLIGRYVTRATSEIQGSIAMIGDNLFAQGISFNGRIVSLGISDLQHILLEQDFAVAGLTASGAVCGVGKYFYWEEDKVGSSSSNLSVYDVSDPYNITLRGQVNNWPNRVWDRDRAVAWSRAATNYVTYITYSGVSRYLSTFNVTNPLAPALVGNYAIPSETPDQFILNGAYAYVATAANHFVVLDYSTPASPSVTSTTNLPVTYSNGFGSMTGGHSTVYVGDDQAPGMIVAVDVSNPAAPVMGTPFRADPTDPHALGGMAAYKMLIDGAYLICMLFDTGATSTGGLSIFSLETPLSPRNLDRYDDYFYSNQPNATMYQGIAVKNRMIYCTGTDAASQSNIFVFGY